MNFFGHVAVASWRGATPALALGAMLPDLAAMAGVRPARIERPDVERGVELHHATDAAFHRLEAFTALCGQTARALRARGVDRGPARAAAHVGVELALDGVLLADDRAATLYLEAVADRGAAEAIVWQRGPQRFFDLLTRLAERGIPEGYRDDIALTRAVTRALERRPRLALTAGDAAILEAEMPAIRRRVQQAAPALLRALDVALI